MFQVTFNDVLIYESESYNEAYNYFRNITGRNYWPKVTRYTDNHFTRFEIGGCRETPQGVAWVTDNIVFSYKTV